MVYWGFEEVNYDAFAKGIEESFEAGKDILYDNEKFMELNLFLYRYTSKTSGGTWQIN